MLQQRSGLLFIIQPILLLTLPVTGANAVYSSPGKLVSNLSRWMENLPPRLHNVSLTSLAIPGSHDSCSYSISRNSPYSRGLDERVKQIFNHVNTDSAKDIVYRWSVTQSLDILGQLKRGIRYLDLRVSYNQEDGKLYVVHGLTGETLVKILEQVKEFAKAFPKEVVLIDVNHFYVGKIDGVLPTRLLYRQVKKYLDEHLCRRTNVGKLTLDYLWKNEKQIVFFTSTSQPPEYMWPGYGSIVAPFDKKAFQDPDNWIAFLTGGYNSRRPRNTFYVTQGIMQPHWVEILTGLTVNATLKSWISETANPLLMKWLKKRRSGQERINIVIADFIESYNFVPTVLALNSKGSRCVYSTAHLFVMLLTSFLATFSY